MVVKNIQLFSLLLCMINFFIIQPSLVLCEEAEIKIFGIKVKSNEVGEMTKGKEIGYTVLSYVLSGLCALAAVLVVACMCCIFVVCSGKHKGNDLENGRGIPDEDDDESEASLGEEENPENENNKVEKSEG
jgi:hypothetical protein